MTEPDDHVYFHMCPVCGEKATVPGITDHTCDPDRPPPQFLGVMARFAAGKSLQDADLTPPAEPCDTRHG